MDAERYVVLMKVHLRGISLRKGAVITLAGMGSHAFSLLHYGLLGAPPVSPSAKPVKRAKRLP